jgi:hypothetical protein
MVVRKLAGGVYSAALAASGAPAGTAPGVLNDTFDFGPVALLFVASGFAKGIIACTIGFFVIKYSLSYAFQEM